MNQAVDIQASIAKNKEILGALAFNYSSSKSRSIPMQKKNFLQELWHTLGLFTQHNRGNSLIQSAVLNLENGDLVPRTFVILSIQYGSFSCEPDKKNILKDFVEMLNKDLDEEELRVCKYAEGKDYSFFPELHTVWNNICTLYNKNEFDLAMLPPTPHYAYAFLALNRPKTFSELHGATLFDELSLLEQQMQKVVGAPVQTYLRT